MSVCTAVPKLRKTVPAAFIAPVSGFISLCIILFSGPAVALLPFEQTGNLYVSMWTSNEIAVFAPDGTPQGRFTADGLDGPRGIAFNPANGDIWVASEFGNAIFIFNSEHHFLRTLAWTIHETANPFTEPFFCRGIREGAEYRLYFRLNEIPYRKRGRGRIC